MRIQFESQIYQSKKNRTKINIAARRCKPDDFLVIEKEKFIAYNLNQYIRPDRINFTLEGLFTDPEYNLIKFDVFLKYDVMANLTKYIK